jgi:hypothetical protein
MLLSYHPYDTTTTRTNQILRMTNSRTNLVSGGQASLNNAFGPTTVSDYMNFNGTQAIRFSENSNNWKVTAPYSVELECMCSNTLDGKYIATNGEAFGGGWGEWSLYQSGGKIVLVSSASNNGNQFTLDMVPSLQVDRWYRLGWMFYTSGSDFRCRTFTNGVQSNDVLCLEPFNSANGLSFGADWSYSDPSITTPGILNRRWTGRLRNVTIGRALFWPV